MSGSGTDDDAPLVLVVEDDRSIGRALARALPLHGFRVVTAVDGLEAFARMVDETPAVVVLDIGLPGPDGRSVAQRLRSGGSSVPILMLTARDTVEDRVAGLDSGADDYLTKPFALEELVARLRALLRRAVAPEGPERRRVADVVVDLDARNVLRSGREVALSPTEYAILELLLDPPGRVVTREHLTDILWDGVDVGPNALEQHVAGLRRKLEAQGGDRVVHTVRGVGYVARP
jgi:two-component system, OmpR family, response regulator MprA